MKKDITNRLLDLDVLGPATLREAVDNIKNLRQSNTDLVQSINHLVDVNEKLCVQRHYLLRLLYRAVEALTVHSGGESKELAYIEKSLKTFKAKANIDA
jgi:hypothetical protein